MMYHHQVRGATHRPTLLLTQHSFLHRLCVCAVFFSVLVNKTDDPLRAQASTTATSMRNMVTLSTTNWSCNVAKPRERVREERDTRGG